VAPDRRVSLARTKRCPARSIRADGARRIGETRVIPDLPDHRIDGSPQAENGNLNAGSPTGNDGQITVFATIIADQSDPSGRSHPANLADRPEKLTAR